MSAGLTCIFLLSILFFYGTTAFSITSPASNSRIGLHAMFRVAWTSDPLVTSITIQLAEGPSSAALQITGTLAQNISAETAYAIVTAPSTIKPGSKYHLRLQGNNGMVATAGPITFFQDIATGFSSSGGIARPTSSFSNILPSFSFPTIGPSSASRPSSSISLSSSPSKIPVSSSVAQSSSSSSSSVKPSSSHESVQGSGDQGSSSNLSSPEIAGIAIGSVVAAALVFGGFLLVRKRSTTDDKHDGQIDAISEIFASPRFQQEPPQMTATNTGGFNGDGGGGRFYSTGYEPYSPPAATYDNRMPSPTLPTAQPQFYQMGSYTLALAPIPPQQQYSMMPFEQQHQQHTNYYPAYWGDEQQQYHAYPPEVYYENHEYHHPSPTPQSPHRR